MIAIRTNYDCSSLQISAIHYMYLAKQIKKAPDEESRENLLHAIAAHAPVAWVISTCSKSTTEVTPSFLVLPLLG